MTKKQKIAYYVINVLVSAAFLFAAFPKLSADPQAIQGFAVVGLPVWFVYTIGILEVLGVIGLWIPRVARRAAEGLIIIMIAATIITAVSVSVVVAILPFAVGILLCVQTWLMSKRASAGTAPTPAHSAPGMSA